MLLTKNSFFFLLLLVLLGPFIGYNLIWLAGSQKTKGKVQGIGHRTGMNFGASSYALVSFAAGKDTVWFQGMDEEFREGDSIYVHYNKSNPEDARVTTVLSIWGDTFAYGGVAFIVWVVLLFSDIVPKNSYVKVGGKSFLKIYP